MGTACPDGSFVCPDIECPYFPGVSIGDEINSFWLESNGGDGSGGEDWTIYYNSSAEIGGFQFHVEFFQGGSGNVTGYTIADVSFENFEVNLGSNTFVGYSLTGYTLPISNVGEYTQFLHFNVDCQNCINGFSNINIVDPFGDELQPSFFLDSFCGDSNACNYEEAGLCTYIAAGACDCDGNVLDCLGECGGDTIPAFECWDYYVLIHLILIVMVSVVEMESSWMMGAVVRQVL